MSIKKHVVFSFKVHPNPIKKDNLNFCAASQCFMNICSWLKYIYKKRMTGGNQPLMISSYCLCLFVADLVLVNNLADTSSDSTVPIRLLGVEKESSPFLKALINC